MLSYFRINDPYRLLGLFIILVVVRIPFLFYSDLIFTPEIKWLLLGEKLAEGKLLYKHVWDTTEPLSGISFMVIHFIFGKSVLAYRIISLFLVAFYSLIYSKILIDNNVYQEKTYVPAMIFGILSCLFFDFFTLSPPLLGMFFIILGMDYIFKLLDKGLNDHQYYNMGFLVGISAMFYLPYAAFLILIVLAMFFFSSTSLRKFLLSILGFLFPYLILIIFYSLYYGLESLYYMYFVGFLTIQKSFYLPLENLALLLVIPLFFVVLSFGKILMAPRFINFQQKTQRLMVFYILLGIVSALLSIDLAPFHLFVLLPGLTFFLTHYFLLIRRKFLAELTFGLFVFSIPFIALGSYYHLFGKNGFDYRKLVLEEKELGGKVKGKRILVLGEDYTPYRNNELATPYLNWSLSRNHFEGLNYYEIVLSVFENIRADYPQLIIDERNIAPTLFNKIPALQKHYEACGENIYCLKSTTPSGVERKTKK